MTQISKKDPRTHSIIGAALEVHKADFLCYENVIVELKAISQLTGKEESQVINYLKATGLETGLLLNFGAPSLVYKRYIFNNKSVKSAKSVDIS